ncbi:hypothetical protein LX36DRAFT_662368 [Colletotrichum falcatum]|nr:hypothetical protein LX36DRAFT_662368 [Colletotrichum falcatum]
MTQTHKDILKLFKLDHGNKIVETAEKEGKVHVGTWKYGPYRLCGHLNVPSDSVCTFIPLNNADGTEASSQRVWNKVGDNKLERVIWQTESPFRVPAYGRLYIDDSNLRFLMERYIFKVNGHGEETQPAMEAAKAGEGQLKTCEAPRAVIDG